MLIWLGVFYYCPQWFPITRFHNLIASNLDKLIPFLPESAWIYQSLFFLLPIALFIQPNQPTLVRFVCGFCLLVLSFSIIFWFYPTALPEPIYPAKIPLGFRYLVMEIDVHKNVFPSLHAALSIYAGASIFILERRNKIRCSLLIIWIAILLISTLTTKQHIIIDVVAGASAGLIFYILANQVNVTNRDSNPRSS